MSDNITESSGEHRFKGILANEYRLMKLAYPHLEQFQGKIGQCVQSYEPVEYTKKLKVLETGCGEGVTTNVLLGCRNDIDLISIDIEPDMVAKAEKNLTGWLAIRDFKLIVADALQYVESIPDNCLDIIASAWTLHNFLTSYRDQFLTHSLRVLKHGGLFVNGDKYAQLGEVHQHALAIQIGRFFDAYIPIGEYEFLKDFVLHNIADEAPERIMRETDSIKDIETVGFTDISIQYRVDMEAVLVASKPFE